MPSSKTGMRGLPVSCGSSGHSTRAVWRTVYAGLNLKGIYRNLGEYPGWGFAADVGAAARFETPHVGQAPKAPTYEELEKEYQQEQKGIDAEK